MNRALIVLGGDAPEPTFLARLAAECDYLLCADSGLDAALAAEVHVDAVIGDFDSVKPDSVGWMKRYNIPHIVYPSIKDDTDGMACVRFILEQKPTEVILAGGGGGRIDHYLANFQLMVYLEKNGVKARMEQEGLSIWAVHNEKTVVGNAGDLLSVLQMTADLQLSLSGLFYPLDHYDVEFGYPIGVSNVMTDTTAKITVHRGWALVVHYHSLKSK